MCVLLGRYLQVDFLVRTTVSMVQIQARNNSGVNNFNLKYEDKNRWVTYKELYWEELNQPKVYTCKNL